MKMFQWLHDIFSQQKHFLAVFLGSLNKDVEFISYVCTNDGIINTHIKIIEYKGFFVLL